MSKSKDQLEYEERLKRRLIILKEEMKNGKVKFNKDLKVIESLKKVKYGPDGEIDLETVDGFVRSLAIDIEYFHDRNEAKGIIPLKEIQQIYFQFIERNFGEFYKMMTHNKATPHQIAEYISSSKHVDEINYLDGNISGFIDIISEFWEANGEIAHYHVEDMYGITKGVFGGDLFPSNESNIASKCGIYIDTIILPDPYYHSKILFEKWDKKQRVYYFIKDALNILQYKDLALAETEPPIIVILPDKDMMSEHYKKQLLMIGEKDALYHASKIFGKHFGSLKELLNYSNKLDTVEKVLKKVKNAHKILFDVDFKEPIYKQILDQTKGVSSQILGSSNPGFIVAMQGVGRMNQCNDLIMKSLKLNGTPIIDAPTSWEFFKWKLEYDSERSNPNEDITNLHIVKALNNLGDTPLQWLGKIPTDALIELRKTGAINEIRNIIFTGIEEITNSNKLDFNLTSQKVFNNLNSAFTNHINNIDNLKKKKWKFAGKDIGSWLVSGVIEVAAVFTGTPLFGLTTFAINQFLDVPKIKDLPNKAKEIRKEDLRLKKSPIGLLFKYNK